LEHFQSDGGASSSNSKRNSSGSGGGGGGVNDRRSGVSGDGHNQHKRQQQKEQKRQLLQFEPVNPEVLGGGYGADALADASLVLAPLTAHFGTCAVCYYDAIPLGSGFPEYCFKTFRVTGDATEMAQPRHPASVCWGCLKKHSLSAIKSGKLFVRCPFEGCGRSLQTLELKRHVCPKDYSKLVQGLKEAEEGVQQQDDDDNNGGGGGGGGGFGGIEGIELRLCPRCNVRIEKNEGCSSMVCYRCGEHFGWA
jgi:hypothetical protein